jgi:hypothetical protein
MVPVPAAATAAQALQRVLDLHGMRIGHLLQLTLDMCRLS